MNNIEQMVQDLVAGNKDAARSQFNAIFSEKAAAGIETFKQEVGSNFFNAVKESTDVDTEYDEAKLAHDIFSKKAAAGRRFPLKGSDKTEFNALHTRLIIAQNAAKNQVGSKLHTALTNQNKSIALSNAQGKKLGS